MQNTLTQHHSSLYMKDVGNPNVVRAYSKLKYWDLDWSYVSNRIPKCLNILMTSKIIFSYKYEKSRDPNPQPFKGVDTIVVPNACVTQLKSVYI